jgi:hypothetical protein
LLLKWALLFKKGIVVVNVRYYLESTSEGPLQHPLTSKLTDRANTALSEQAQ